MAFDINGVSSANYYAQMNALAEQATDPVQAQVKADEAKADKEAQNEDGFKKEPFNKPKAEEINALRQNIKTNMGAFQAMVQGLFQKQGGYKMSSLDDTMSQISEAMQKRGLGSLEGENGEDPWGAEAVAGRILDFAKALAGGDESKLAELQDAVEKGFKQAESLWGGEGKLPGVSYDTLELIRQGFDNWRENGFDAPAQDPNATTAAASTVTA